MLTPFQARALSSLEVNRFFEALGEERMRWVSRTALRKGETLFEKGAPSDSLYGVVSGQLKLCSSGADGRQVFLDLVAPGELLGEIGIADGAPRHASAVALLHSELAAIRCRDLERLMDEHAELRTVLWQASARAARRLTRRLEDGAFLSIEERVEKALIDLARRMGERVDRGTRVRLRQQDLADVLGLSRESVSRVLTSPAMRGRLELGRGSIVLIEV